MTNNSGTRIVWLAALTAAAICFASFAFAKMFEAQTSYSCDVTEVAVTKGDTVWSLAKQHCVGDIRSVIEDSAKMNPARLDIGDVVRFKARG